MANLDKDPRLFGLRSIRQGATTTAEETEMPEAFIRTSGGWKGRAMARYRKDRLPENQKTFAEKLGSSRKPVKPFTSSTLLHEFSNPNSNHAGCPARPNRASRGSPRAVRGSTRDFSSPAVHRLNVAETVKWRGSKGADRAQTKLW